MSKWTHSVIWPNNTIFILWCYISNKSSTKHRTVHYQYHCINTNTALTQAKHQHRTNTSKAPWSTTAPTGPQLAPTGPQHAPTGPQHAPTGPQHAPTGPQHAPTSAGVVQCFILTVEAAQAANYLTPLHNWAGNLNFASIK